MQYARIKKDDSGFFRIYHVGVELPGRYSSYAVAEFAFSLPDKTLLALESNSLRKSGTYRCVITLADIQPHLKAS